METLLQDVKQALRMFRKNPAFTATAVLAIALGIGANTAIFSVVNVVLLKPLPFPEPDRLVAVMHSFRGEPMRVRATPADFVHWRGQTDAFEDVAAWRNVSLDYRSGDMPETIAAAAVSSAYFRTLGATFVTGRGFSNEEDIPGAGSTVVVSHRFWARRLNSDPDIVGKTLRLSGVAHTIVGVTAENFDVRELSFRELSQPDVWVPLQLAPNTTEVRRFLDVFARLKNGVTLEQAQQRLATSVAEYRERFPLEEPEGWSFTALRLQESIVRDARPNLLMLTGAVGLVLLIVCANVANLLLIRALSRNREIAVRSALGAGSWRIARQLLTESVVLALAGGALGLAAGFLGMRWLLSAGTIDLPRLGGAAGLLSIDWRVAGFALALSIVTALVFGLVPALLSTRTDLNAVMKDGTGASGGRRRIRAQSALVMIETAVAVVLVVGAALLVRTAFALGAVDLGMSVHNVLTMRTALTEPRFQSAAGLTQLSNTVLDRVRSIPGVEAATMAWGVPLQDNGYLPFDIADRQNSGPATGASVAVASSAGYFDTLKIRLVAGRRFDERDTGGTPAVVVINQAMADRYWPDGNAFEGRIRIPRELVPEAAGELERQVIGIVGNVRQQGFMGDAQPTMYFPIAQVSDGLSKVMTDWPMAWMVRTSIDAGTVSAQVQEVLREETGQPVTDLRLMEETWAVSISHQRLNMWLMTICGGSALVLGAIGIYGLMAYSAQQRRHEIGIRMALGAEPGAVRNMVIGEGMLLALIGIGVGLGGAYAFANVLASILFGVKPHDVAVFVTVPVVLVTVALAAVSIPAVRASRVDPTDSLRHS
jgi:putative ABC transport system permease protein